MNCTYCGKEIQETDRFCPHCDGYIKQNEESTRKMARQKREVTSTIMVNCYFCRKKVDQKTKLCPHCGRKVDGTTNAFAKLYSTPPPTRPRTDDSNNLAVVGFVLAFFIPFIALLLCMLGRRKSYETDTGYELATAGIVISILSILLYTAAFIKVLRLLGYI